MTDETKPPRERLRDAVLAEPEPAPLTAASEFLAALDAIPELLREYPQSADPGSEDGKTPLRIRVDRLLRAPRPEAAPRVSADDQHRVDRLCDDFDEKVRELAAETREREHYEKLWNKAKDRIAELEAERDRLIIEYGNQVEKINRGSMADTMPRQRLLRTCAHCGATLVRRDVLDFIVKTERIVELVSHWRRLLTSPPDVRDGIAEPQPGCVHRGEDEHGRIADRRCPVHGARADENARERITELEAELAELEAKLAAKTRECETANNRIAALEAKLAAKTRECALLQEGNDTNRRRITKLEAELDAANLAAARAEERERDMEAERQTAKAGAELECERVKEKLAEAEAARSRADAVADLWKRGAWGVGIDGVAEMQTRVLLGRAACEALGLNESEFPSHVREAVAELQDKIQRLKGQLPEGMEHCTIRFVECPRGHGRLTADHWEDPGCLHCKVADKTAVERAWCDQATPELAQDLRECAEGWGEAADACEAVWDERSSKATVEQLLKTLSSCDPLTVEGRDAMRGLLNELTKRTLLGGA